MLTNGNALGAGLCPLIKGVASVSPGLRRGVAGARGVSPRLLMMRDRFLYLVVILFSLLDLSALFCSAEGMVISCPHDHVTLCPNTALFNIPWFTKN